MNTLPAERPRCPWPGDDALMQRYHDEEWGVPVHDEIKWMEYIILDAFQAGLSWRTVLHKRDAFRKVFHDFDPRRVARMTEKQIEAAAPAALVGKWSAAAWGTTRSSRQGSSWPLSFNLASWLGAVAR